MNIFQTFINNRPAVVFQKLGFIAVLTENINKQIKMNFKHIRSKDCIIHHILGKFNSVCILIFFHFKASLSACCGKETSEPDFYRARI